MICEICGREKDENTVLCTQCGPQCDCGGSCSSHKKSERKIKRIVENMVNRFRRGYSKE